MMKRFFAQAIFALLLLCVALPGFAEPAYYSEWSRVYIGNIGSLQYPATLEVQSEEYRQAAEAQGRFVHDVNSNDVVLRQRGLNANAPAARDTFAYVYFHSMPAKGAPRLSDPIVLSPAELKRQYEDELLQTVSQDFRDRGLRIVSHGHAKVTSVNGIPCIYTWYRYQVKDKPVVIVHHYNFYNCDYIHTLDIAYREGEGAFWQAPGRDIRDVVRTLDIRRIGGSRGVG